MTKVQQATDTLTAQATKLFGGRIRVTVRGVDGQERTATVADEMSSEYSIDNATDELGFYRSGPFRDGADGSLEFDVYVKPARPAVPGWADAVETDWSSRLPGIGLLSCHEVQVGDATISQVVTARDGALSWGGLEICADHVDGFLSPAGARALAGELLRAADEAERIAAVAR